MSGKESEILRWKNLHGPNSDLPYVAYIESGQINAGTENTNES